MRPIVLIHGYSSEGKNTKVEDIYGDLPSYLRDHFGADNLVEISLARWISLNDGISIDDISGKGVSEPIRKSWARQSR
jgi:hypothetical protein